MKNEKKIKNMLIHYLVMKYGEAEREHAKKETVYVIKKDRRNEFRYVSRFIAAERKRLADMNKELDVLEDLIKSSTSSP